MSSPVASPSELIAFAIERGICVLAVYNRSETVLAPESLFERNGDTFLKAVTLETDGRTPKVLKLGTFKLAGLTDLRLSGRSFDGGALFAEVAATAKRIAAAKTPRRRG